MKPSFIDHEKITDLLTKNGQPISENELDAILLQAKKLAGLTLQEVLKLSTVTEPTMVQKIFEAAAYAKEEIYGKRLVLFAPLYISNRCNNECLYCAFRHNNSDLDRRSLDMDEVKKEAYSLIDQGQKRVLLVAGEEYGSQGLDYVLEAIDAVYSVSHPKGNIRRINVNIAPLSVDDFKRLEKKQIGTYQLFQETYHRETYKRVHTKGPKSNYEYRLQVMDRALQAGLHDIGVGVLFGLYDWRYELAAMLMHINHLEETYGVGPHTISLPRLEPAFNSPDSYTSSHLVSDEDFLKIIAILRLAVPYTGLILSTRESAEVRRASFELGISQISAASKTNPGGYAESSLLSAEQFSLGDHRSVLEVVKDIVSHDYIPSFCTACYRKGRVGKDFMDLAKPGLIKEHCLPNGLFTFKEYMNDFGDLELHRSGEKLIAKMVERDITTEKKKVFLREKLNLINNGERDYHL